MSLKVFRLIAVAVLLGAIVFFVSNNSDDLASLAGLKIGTALFVALLVAISTTLYAHSMFVYLGPLVDSQITRWAWQSLVFASRLLNYTLPQGANIYRGAYLKKRYKLPVTSYVGLVLFHSWIFATLTFWTSAVLLYLVDADTSVRVFAVGLAASATACGAPAVFRVRLPETYKAPFGWLFSRLNLLSSTMTTLIRHWSASARLSLIVVATFLLTAVSIYWILGELSETASMPAAIFLAVIFTLNRFVNVVPANLGLTELLTGAAYEFLGGSLVIGILVSAVLRVIEFGVALALGSVAVFFSDHRLGEEDA